LDSSREQTLRDSESFGAFRSLPHKSLKWSNYFAVYDRFLSRFWGQEVTVVEIGVLDGGSLFMWRALFGPSARIVGVDINPQAKIWENHGFEILIGSQEDPSFLQSLSKLVGKAHVIVDDGGHTYLQQIRTANYLSENVVDGGVYIIEDTHTSMMPGYGLRTHNTFKWGSKIAKAIQARHFGELTCNPYWGVAFFDSMVVLMVDRREIAPPELMDSTPLELLKSSDTGRLSNPTSLRLANYSRVLSRTIPPISFLLGLMSDALISRGLRREFSQILRRGR
jgi:hypothetical protein